MAIKIVALDLDDTLLDSSRRISPRNREAIAAAVRRGVTVTLATGRMYRATRPYAAELGVDVPLIVYDGAMIKKGLSGETLFHQPLETATAARVLAWFKRYGWYSQVYEDDELYAVRYTDEAELYFRQTGVRAREVGEALYTRSWQPTKVVAIAPAAQVPEIMRRLQGELGDAAYVTTSKPRYVEVLHPQVSKGRALAQLARQRGAARQEVMAVGDSLNDLDMLAYAGLGVAMGNARDEVKERADAVTAANDADGVAEAIERYVLAAARHEASGT